MPLREPFVCGECIDDLGIINFISFVGTEGKCSFCDEEPSKVAPLDDVTEHMETCLKEEYDDALNWLYYDRETGDFIGRTWDTWDLITDDIGLNLPNDYDGKLLREIIDRLPEIVWCEAKPYDLPSHEKVRYNWARFCEIVMHRRRFFFEDYAAQPSDGTSSPGEILRKIFEYADMYDLFEVLPVGTQLFRARRLEPGTRLTTAQDLGPPPKAFANQANRMSPPGIPMFYGCDCPETSLRETSSKVGRFTVGCFRTLRAATILDLTGIPTVPSLFEAVPDRLEFRPREVLGFLNHLADEMSKPIQRDDRAHVNYVPTQVVTEFVRSRVERRDSRIYGIKFLSAVHPGYVSYVIFCTQENLFPAPERSLPLGNDRWLELASAREHDVTREDIMRWEKEIPPRYERDYQQLLYGEA